MQENVLAVFGIGVALSALIAAQGSAQGRQIAELRRDVDNARERFGRMEGIMGIIQTGMQPPRPNVEPEHQYCGPTRA